MLYSIVGTYYQPAPSSTKLSTGDDGSFLLHDSLARVPTCRIGALLKPPLHISWVPRYLSLLRLAAGYIVLYPMLCAW